MSPRPSRDPLIRALSALPRVSRRRMLGGTAFFAGRRCFAVVRTDALVLRLDPATREELLVEGAGRPFGLEVATPAPEWVELARPVTLGEPRLHRLLERAHAVGRSRRALPVMGGRGRERVVG